LFVLLQIHVQFNLQSEQCAASLIQSSNVNHEYQSSEPSSICLPEHRQSQQLLTFQQA